MAGRAQAAAVFALVCFVAWWSFVTFRWHQAQGDVLDRAAWMDDAQVIGQLARHAGFSGQPPLQARRHLQALAAVLPPDHRLTLAADADAPAICDAMDKLVVELRAANTRSAHKLGRLYGGLVVSAILSSLGAIATLLLWREAVRRRRLAEALQTDLQLAAEDAEAARSRAVHADAVKARFLANLSHELRTPLSGVVGLGDLLQASSVDPVQRQQLATMTQSARSLLQVINDILDFSRIDAGRVHLRDELYPVRGVLDDAMATTASAGQSKGLQVLAFVAADVPEHWRGDGPRVRQVLTNLLGNAVKFTDVGTVLLEATLQDGHLRLAVRDTGPGVAQADLERLFQPFAQVDESATRRHGGTGLGLAISRELVERLGGHITVDSEVGRGSTFAVHLPRKDGTAQPPTPPRLACTHAVLALEPGALHDTLARMLGTLGLQLDPPDSPALQARWVLTTTARLRHHRRQGLPEGTLVAVAPLAEMDAAQVAEAAGARHLLLLPWRDADLRALVEGRAPALERQRALATAQTGPDAATVLVVEDDPISAEVAAISLRRLGLTAHRVGDGATAVDMAGRGRYAAILMDLQLPGLDGLEATRRIRAGERADGRDPAPILCLTASANPSDHGDLSMAGLSDLIQKPISVGELAAVLVRHGVQVQRRR